MCGKAYDPRLIAAWPSAELAVMSGASAAKVLLQIETAALKKKGEEIILFLPYSWLGKRRGRTGITGWMTATLCQAMLRYSTLRYVRYVHYVRYALLRYTILCYPMLRWLRCATLRYAMLRYATLRYATIRYDTLQYATIRHAMCSAKISQAVLHTHLGITTSRERARKTWQRHIPPPS